MTKRGPKPSSRVVPFARPRPAFPDLDENGYPKPVWIEYPSCKGKKIRGCRICRGRGKAWLVELV